MATLRLALLLALSALTLPAASPGFVVEGTKGPGHGRHIVILTGDEEYRSEQSMPHLARILALRHGFKCTVLFAIDPADGTINPNVRDNIPGLEALDHADLAIFFLRWRNLPDDQMKHIVDYIESGRPMIGLRTATHSFKMDSSPTYARYSSNSKEWDGGFGRQVLGETWVNHHGRHGVQGTRARLAPGAKSHPILRGIEDGAIFGTTDVYTVSIPPFGDSQTLLLGEVVDGLEASAPAAPGKLNDPMMPLAWTKTYTGKSGRTARVFTTTMGGAQDFANENFRRLLVNASYWTLGLEAKLPAHADVTLTGDFNPLPFKNNGFEKGVHPADLPRH